MSYGANSFFLCFLILMPTHGVGEALNNQYPAVWGDLSLETDPESQCPNLNGTYSDESDGYAEMEGIPTAASLNGTLHPRASSVLSFEKKPMVAVLDSDKKVLKVTLSHELITISFPSAISNDKTESYLFNKNDYLCQNGWLNFQEQKQRIDRESSHVDYRLTLSLSKLKNGSLLVSSREFAKESSIWFFGAGKYVETFRMHAKFNAIIVASS